jgi:hypothetical protein
MQIYVKALIRHRKNRGTKKVKIKMMEQEMNGMNTALDSRCSFNLDLFEEV